MPSEEAPLITSAVVSTTLSTTVAVIITVAVVVAVRDDLIFIGVVNADVVAITTDSEVNSIIDGSTLGNWHDDRLVVRSGGDGGHPVYTCRETLGDIGTELTTGSGSIETLEERKDTWVSGIRRLKGSDLFNDDVIVSDDLASIVQLLRGSIVGVGSVGEGTGLHSPDVHDDGEWGVRLDIAAVGRELELHGRHVVDAGNITHRGGVARASLNLLAVCDGLADTESDEVVGADQGVGFTGCLTLTINILNNGRVQGEGGLRVASVTTVGRGGLGVVTTVDRGGLGVVSGVVAAIVTTVIAAIVATVITAIVTAVIATIPSAASAAAKPIVLTGHEAARLRDEEGDGELGDNEENEGELEALHGSCPDGRELKLTRFWSGRNDGVGSKQASLSKRLKKTKGLVLERGEENGEQRCCEA